MISFDKKISFDEFQKLDFDVSDFDKDYIADWNNRSFFSQMMDSFGEMNYTLQIYNNNENNLEKTKKSLQNFHNVCCLIYNNPNVYEEEKNTLKYAEWEFINYILWNSNEKSCIKWFQQWNNDINFDLL